MHTKKCLARAIIAAIENERDDEHISDYHFRLAAQINEFLALADEYLRDGTMPCYCSPTERPRY